MFVMGQGSAGVDVGTDIVCPADVQEQLNVIEYDLGQKAQQAGTLGRGLAGLVVGGAAWALSRYGLKHRANVATISGVGGAVLGLLLGKALLGPMLGGVTGASALDAQRQSLVAQCTGEAPARRRTGKTETQAIAASFFEGLTREQAKTLLLRQGMTSAQAEEVLRGSRFG